MHTTKDEMRNAKNVAADYAHDARSDMRDVANKAGRKARDFFDNASEEFSNASDNVTSHIRDNPIKASIIALGTGFILGALFRR